MRRYTTPTLPMSVPLDITAAGIPMEIWTVDTESAITGMNPYITGVTSNSLIAGKVLYDANI